MKFLKYKDFRDILFVFGAGASYAEGAPLQSELLPYILSESDRKISKSKLGRAVIEFVKAFFYVSNDFTPTLESVFGFIDYLIHTKESLGGECNTARIAEIRESLIKLIHYTVQTKRKEKTSASVYKIFWDHAKDNTLNIGVISLNYDTLLDEAFDFPYPDYGYIDYCIHLMNYDWYDKYHNQIGPFNWWTNPREPVPVWEGSNPQPIKIIKLHGSLNWKYCNCCNQVLLTPWSSEIDLDTMGFVRYGYSKNPHNPEAVEFRCPLDTMRFSTLITPPSHIKEISHPIIRSLMEEAAREIRCAKKVVFVGYSFPDADVHLKALFIKNLAAPCKIFVINRRIDEKILAAYRPLGRETIFHQMTFENSLSNKEVIVDMFSPISV